MRAELSGDGFADGRDGLIGIPLGAANRLGHHLVDHLQGLQTPAVSFSATAASCA